MNSQHERLQGAYESSTGSLAAGATARRFSAGQDLYNVAVRVVEVHRASPAGRVDLPVPLGLVRLGVVIEAFFGDPLEDRVELSVVDLEGVVLRNDFRGDHDTEFAVVSVVQRGRLIDANRNEGPEWHAERQIKNFYEECGRRVLVLRRNDRMVQGDCHDSPCSESDQNKRFTILASVDRLSYGQPTTRGAGKPSMRGGRTISGETRCHVCPHTSQYIDRQSTLRRTSTHADGPVTCSPGPGMTSVPL